MSQTKTARLNALYERLKGANGISMSDLAAEFEVSAKTIQRDFKALQRFGAYKSGRLLYLDESLAKDELANDERVVLGILSKLARASGKGFYLKAKPLLTRLSQQIEQPIYINTQSESLDDSDLLNFDFIEKAIIKRVELAFEYESKAYQIKPFKLAYFGGFWYVLGFDKKDELFKKFYFKAMKNLQSLERSFALDERVEKRLKNAHSVWFNLDEPFLVRLLIDKEVSKYFKRRHLIGATLYEQDDGGLVLECEISHIMQIKPLIYEYIPHISVIEPAWLNETLKKELSDFAKSL